MMRHHLTNRREFLAAAASLSAIGTVSRNAFARAERPLPYFEDRGWLVGCWTRPWAEHDYRVGFDAMAQAGFRYVALTGAKTATGRVIAAQTTIDEAAAVGREARQRGLAITTVHGGSLELEKGPETLRKMIDLCQAAGAWSVLLTSMGSEATYATCCRTAMECCAYAAEKRIALVLKPHGGTTGTGPQLRAALRQVNRPNFTLMYDPGNIFYYSDGKIDPVDDCQAVLGLVTSLSVKDFRAPKEIMLTPGTGQVDFRALMKKLVQGGFTHGPLMIETLAAGDLDLTLAEAKKAKAFVEKLVAA
jgi:sugar phosphate isomerase/epimerase